MRSDLLILKINHNEINPADRYTPGNFFFMQGRQRMNCDKINLSEKFGKLPVGDYAVRLVAKMNNYDFKIVKFKGDFIWHSHPETDETFIIMDGALVMSFRDRKVEVNAGEMIVIPKGVEHKPSSENGYSNSY